MVADLLYLVIEMMKMESQETVNLSSVYCFLQIIVSMVALIVTGVTVWMAIFSNLFVFTDEIAHTYNNLKYMMGVTSCISMVLLMILLPLLITVQIYFEKHFKQIIGTNSDEFARCVKKQRIMYHANSLGLSFASIMTIG